MLVCALLMGKLCIGEPPTGRLLNCNLAHVQRVGKPTWQTQYAWALKCDTWNKGPDASNAFLGERALEFSMFCMWKPVALLFWVRQSSCYPADFFFFFFAHEQWTKFSFFSLEQASDLYHRLIVVHTESLQTNTKGHKPLLLVEKEIYGN